MLVINQPAISLVWSQLTNIQAQVNSLEMGQLGRPL